MMILTTARRTTASLIDKARSLSVSLGIPYLPRGGMSIEDMKRVNQEDLIIVEKDQVIIAPLDSETPLFYHPNMAMIRAKRWLKGEKEPLIEAAQLEAGMSFLDCTLGLASDSVMASLAVGETGRVTGLEGNPLLYLMVKIGLQAFSSTDGLLDVAMKRIQVLEQEHFTFLKNAPANSYDVVYFDPMFQHAINESDGIDLIRGHALTTRLSSDVIEEAKRVARHSVVLKDHWKSNRFEQLGFNQIKRKTSLFHYGTIELEN